MIAILLLVLLTLLIVVWIMTKESYVPATEDDLIKAHDYAIKQMCRLKGYRVDEKPDGTFDCQHTESTCWRDSEYPPKNGKLYLEWDGVQCNLGLHPYREFCESQGLTYDPDTSTCTTNCVYCKSKVLPFVNGDCYVDPVKGFTEKLFGKTFTRGVSAADAVFQSCDADNRRVNDIDRRKQQLKNIS